MQPMYGHFYSSPKQMILERERSKGQKSTGFRFSALIFSTIIDLFIFFFSIKKLCTKQIAYFSCSRHLPAYFLKHFSGLLIKYQNRIEPMQTKLPFSKILVLFHFNIGKWTVKLEENSHNIRYPIRFVLFMRISSLLFLLFFFYKNVETRETQTKISRNWQEIDIRYFYYCFLIFPFWDNMSINNSYLLNET